MNHRAPQVTLGVTVNPAPVPKDAFERGLQQVLACVLTARQEYRSAQQRFAALGQKAFQLSHAWWFTRNAPPPAAQSVAKDEWRGRKVA